jgi:hypothetical protein
MEIVVRTVWNVRWRGVEEEYAYWPDAFDRWDQLDALGIEAEVFEITDGRRCKVR